MKHLDLTGQRFGMLLVVEKMAPRGRQSLWKCICDCGTESIKQLGNLRNGHTKSCGCLRSTTTKAYKTTHAMYGTATYNSWSSMMTRCTDQGNHKYPDYGGRGIKIHPAWRKFSGFFMDMGERPDGKTLGRIDNDGDYTPGNCEWQDATAQGRNKRNTRIFEFKGLSATLQEHCDRIGMNCSTAKSRIYSYGWSIEKALTTTV